ncbi:MAG: VOC family protein [Betaproteobacteria bacterium]
MREVAGQQLPPAGKICLDHVAHFVPEVDAASDALARLGFTLTPFSPQSHRLQPEGPLLPAGTGNRCVMLNAGYIEFLTPFADTPIAAQLRTAIGRYVGVHLVAFGTSDAQSDHARLTHAGFSPPAPVALQRQIETPQGMDTARFTVVRVPPGTLAEGRIQYCQHLTPQLVWQPRWLEHANGATGLTGVLLCVEDPEETVQRYARFTGLTPRLSGNAWRIDTARGYLAFIDPALCRSTFGVEPPALPWIAGYTLQCGDLFHARDVLNRNGIAPHAMRNERYFVELPPALGGLLVFEPAGSAPLPL